MDWLLHRAKIMPSVAELDSEQLPADNAEIESKKISLQLPSNFSANERQSLGITTFAVIELKLRKAEANDALNTSGCHVPRAF